MARLNTFTFRIDEKEKILLELLAKKLHRSKGDAIRFIILTILDDFRSQITLTNKK